jgi:hypothetical protein
MSCLFLTVARTEASLNTHLEWLQGWYRTGHNYKRDLTMSYAPELMTERQNQLKFDLVNIEAYGITFNMSASKLSLLPIDVALRVFFQMRNKKHVDEGTTSEIWILQGDIDSAKALLADGFHVTLFDAEDAAFAQNILTCAAFLAVPRISQFIFNNDKDTATVHFTRMLMIAACEAIGTFWDCVGGVEGDHPPPSWMFVYSTEGNHLSHGRNHPVGCGNTNAIARAAKPSREAQAHTVFGVMVRTLTGHTHAVENGLFLVPQFKFLPDCRICRICN